jgi:hypothetical protein
MKHASALLVSIALLTSALAQAEVAGCSVLGVW